MPRGKQQILFCYDAVQIIHVYLVLYISSKCFYICNIRHLVMLQAFLYSLEHKIPLVGFSQDRCFSMFEDPLVDSLHDVYHEPKV
jgi:hypothetical protein